MNTLDRPPLRGALPALALLTLLAGAAPAHAQSAVLYSNNFEAPNAPIQASCATLDQRGIQALYGQEGFAYQQVHTVEAVLLERYGTITPAQGKHAIGMLSRAQDDRLALTFHARGHAYLNVGFDLTALDVPGCGGPFGVTKARMQVSLVDSPGGRFDWSQRVLDSVEVEGGEDFSATTAHFVRVLAALKTEGATDGWVSIVFDLVESGYGAFDNLSVVAAGSASVEDRDLDGVADDLDIAPDDSSVCSDHDGDGEDDCAFGQNKHAQGFQPTASTPGTVVLPDPLACKPEKLTNLIYSGRAGYGLAFGDLVMDQTLSDSVAGFVPLMFDLTWRFRFGLELGLGAMLGVGLHGDALDDCNDCSIFLFAFGAQVNYHLLPGQLVDPWIGVLVGVDAMYISSEQTTASGLELRSTTTYRAFPTVTLQGGVDFGGDGFSIGPFASMSFATYTNASQEVQCTGPGCSSEPISMQESDIPDAQQTSHSWLILGAKASFW